MYHVIKNEKNGTIFKKSLDNYHLQFFLNFEQIFFKTIYLRSPHFNQSQPVLLCTFVLQLIQHKKKNLLGTRCDVKQKMKIACNCRPVSQKKNWYNLSMKIS